jgi:hypothetical protein
MQDYRGCHVCGRGGFEHHDDEKEHIEKYCPKRGCNQYPDIEEMKKWDKLKESFKMFGKGMMNKRR